MGLNITPYDNDNTAATGTTTLRHIDQSTRLAWSTFGSVQSDPYAGAARPCRATRRRPVSRPRRRRRTSRTRTWTGPPRRRRSPSRTQRRADLRPRAGAGDAGITIDNTNAQEVGAVEIDIDGRRTGPARVFLSRAAAGRDKGYTPVWNSSCNPATDPPPNDGLSACSAADGSIPPWSPDMSGGIAAPVRERSRPGTQTVSIPLTTARRARRQRRLGAGVLRDGANEVQAFDVPISSAGGGVGGTVPATLSLTLGAPAAFGPFTPGLAKDYFATTPATVTSTAGDAALSVSDPSSTTPAISSTASSHCPDPAGPSPATAARSPSVRGHR